MTLYSKKGETRGSKTTRGTGKEVTGNLNDLNQVARLSGINENTLLTTTQSQAEEQIQKNLALAGMREEDAQQVAENTTGSELLTARTGLNEAKLRNMSLQDIQSKLRTPKEMGISEQDQVALKESLEVMSQLPQRLKAAKSPLAKNLISKDFVALSSLQAKLQSNTHTEVEASRLAYLENDVFVGAHIAKFDYQLTDMGHSQHKREEILTRFDQVGEDKYVQLRSEGKNHKEALQGATDAQTTELKVLLKPEERRAIAPNLENYVAHRLFIQHYIIDAGKTGNTDMLDEAAGATTIEEMQNVNKKYEVISDFEMNRIFGVASTIAASFLAPAEGEAEMGAEAAATAQMIRDIEDMAREDQEQEDEMRKQLEEKERETDEAEEETTEEKKTAIEEMMDHIGELKTGPKEIPPGSGTFLGPFYPNPMEVVKQNNANFTPEVMKTLVAKNFNETAFIAKKGEVDFSSDLTTPEAIVMSYLVDPENTEKKEAFVKVLEEPDNVAVRAALYEALAKTAVEISSA